MSAVNTAGFGAVSGGGKDSDAQPSKLAQQRAHEPSMEEILASIRRIIADDQVLPLAPRSAAPSVIRAAAQAPAVFPLRTAAPQSAARIPVHVVPNPPPPGKDALVGDADDIVGLARQLRAGPGDELAAQSTAATSREAAHASGEVPVDDFRSSPAAENASTVDFEELDAPLQEGDAVASGAASLSSQVESQFEPLVSATTGASVASSFNVLAATMLAQSLPSVEELARDILRPMLKSWLDDNLPVLVERLVRTEIERVARGGR